MPFYCLKQFKWIHWFLCFGSKTCIADFFGENLSIFFFLSFVSKIYRNIRLGFCSQFIITWYSISYIPVFMHNAFMLNKFWNFVSLVLIRKFQKFLLRILKKFKHGTIQCCKDSLSEASCYSELYYLWNSLCGLYIHFYYFVLNCLDFDIFLIIGRWIFTADSYKKIFGKLWNFSLFSQSHT